MKETGRYRAEVASLETPGATLSSHQAQESRVNHRGNANVESLDRGH